MKLLFSILFALISLSVLAQPEFKVDKAIHKFPKSEKDLTLHHTFKVTNTGNTPLVISDYKVACPCTKVVLPKEPIPPGKTIDLKVTFDTTDKAYYQDRVIYLQTNTKSKEEKIRIKVFVIPDEE